MDIENPSEEVVAAINGAYNWFQDHKISGIRIDEFRNEDGERDRVVVEDSTAPDVWARFYDLETGEPFFSNRDGIKKKTMADLDINRRGGYRWYTRDPEKVLEKYADWTGKVN